MINTILSVIWPIKEFVNFIFHKTLGDYIINDLNLSYIEDEIKKNYEIVLSNLMLNSYEINKKHLGASPIKLLEGNIKKLRIQYPKNNEKIQIAIEDLYLTLMPIQNSEKISKKKINAKSIFNKEENKENSIIATMLNRFLHNLEISIKNTCVKICTYEIENNTRNNPTFTIIIGKIGYSKFKENNYNKLFLFNKKIQLDDFCIRVSHNINNDEQNYFNSFNDDKLENMSEFEKKKERKERLFLMNSDSSTILTVNKVENDEYCSVMLRFLEDSDDNLKIQMDITNFEIILNCLQLYFITNFIEVCNIIFNKMNKKQDSNQNFNIDSVNNTPYNDKIPFLNLLGFKLNNIIPCFNLSLMNIVLCQNKKNDLPRLWTFLDYKYPERLDSFEKIQRHFMYFEDNVFILNISNIFVNSVKSLVNTSRSTEIFFGNVLFNYNVFKSKTIKSFKQENLKNHQLINDSKIVEGSSYGSVYESIYNKADIMASNLKLRRSENSKDMIFTSIFESKEFFIKNYHTLLNFEFIYDSFEILNIIAKSSYDSSNSSFFELFSNKNYTFSIKILNKIVNNNISSKNKTMMTAVFPDIKVNLHPILLIHFTNLFYNNILIINDIMYNDLSQSIVSKVFDEKEDNNTFKAKLNENNKEEKELVCQDSIEDENNFMNSTIVLPNTSKKKEEESVTKSSKKKLFIYLGTITINIYNFKKEDFDTFYSNLFIKHIQNVVTNKWLNKKIDIIDEIISYLHETKKDDIISLVLFDSEVFLKKNDKKPGDLTSSFNFNHLLLSFRRNGLVYPLIEYNNHTQSTNCIFFPDSGSEDRSRKYSKSKEMNFITENAEKKKNEIFESNNFQLFDIDKFEKKFYTLCDNKFKKWGIRIKMKDSVKNDVVSEINKYFSSYNIKNIKMDKGESISSSTINTIKVSLSLGHFNFFFDFQEYEYLLSFIDLLLYSLNTNNIFTTSIRKINKELKSKVLKIFDLDSANNEIISNTDIKNVFILESVFKTINLIACKTIHPVEDIKELYLEKELIYRLIDNPFLKISLLNSKVSIFNMKKGRKEILISCDNLKMLLRKKEYNKEDLIVNFFKPQESEGLFHHILYKGCQDENVSIIRVVLRIKENFNQNENSIFSEFFNQNFTEKPKSLFNNYFEFIQRNRIITNNQNVKLVLYVNQCVISPFFEQFDINFIVDLNKLITQSEKTNEKLFEKMIDFKKLDLFTPSQTIIVLRVECSKLIIDSFIDYKKDVFTPPTELKNKMRMIIILEGLKYEESFENHEKCLILSFHNMNIVFLKNLAFPNANTLIDNYEHTLINENSFLNMVGFVELLYLEGFYISFKNYLFNNIELNMKLNNFEANFCSDSLKSFKIFISNIIKEVKLIRKLFKKEKISKEISEIIDEKPKQDPTIYVEIDSMRNMNSIFKSCYFDQNFKDKEKNEVLSDEIELECDDPLENLKEEEIKKKHKYFKYSITINLIKLNLFDGKDFSFFENGGVIDISSSINNSQKSNNTISSNNSEPKFQIINDYITSQKSLKIESKSRKRLLRRNYENQINISLQSFESELNFDNLSKIPLKFTLKIQKAEIDDLIKDSKYKKMFSKYNYDSKNPVLKLSFEILNYSNLNPIFVFQERQNFDISLDFQLEPLNIQVDQNSLLFLLKMFKVNLNKDAEEECESIIDDKLKTEQEINKRLLESINDNYLNQSSKVQITAIKVSLMEFFVNISYNSHKLSFNQIKNKNYLELLNISNIKDFKIVFNKYVNPRSLDLFDLINHLINFWKEDIKNHQLVTAVFSSISYLRPFNNMLNGFLELVKQPYLAIKDHKNFKKGLAKGFANFFISLSSESIFLGEKFINFFSGFVGKDRKNNKRKSVYKNYLHLVNERIRKHDNYFLK